MTTTPGPTQCPNGHLSDEADYCSVCGAPMGGSAPAASPATACPSCGTPRAQPDARYCEVCRYDFDARTPGPPPVATAPAAPVPMTTWEVTITVDPSLDVDPDPATPAPTDAAERSFPIDLPDMLIGRRDDRRDIRPDIPILDPAVSRRHAKLLRLPDGGLAVLDVASANGTAVNGTEIASGERHALADGDTITLGRWTRITVHRG